MNYSYRESLLQRILSRARSSSTVQEVGCRKNVVHFRTKYRIKLNEFPHNEANLPINKCGFRCTRCIAWFNIVPELLKGFSFLWSKGTCENFLDQKWSFEHFK